MTTVQMETHTTSIVLFDLVGYSQLSDEQQFLSIKLLSQSLSQMLLLVFGQSFLKKEEVLLGIVPTGDGAYMILNHALANYGVLFALSMRTIVLQQQRRAPLLFRGVRTAVHLGTVIPVKDLTGGSNFVGTGLNDCARLCSATPPEASLVQVQCEDGNWVVASDAAFTLFESAYGFPEAKAYRQTIGFRASDVFEFDDKHQKRHTARLIEGSRSVVSNPPRPADIHERLEALAASVRAPQAT